MPNTWKWKVGVFVALVCISLYLLVPTLFGFKQKLVEAETEGAELPWYYEIFPAKGINLGLDLRGGIYLEFDVRYGKAIENKVDTIISDIRRLLDDEKLGGVKLRQKVADHSILVTASTPETAEKAADLINSNFSDALASEGPVSGRPGSWEFSLDDRYESYLKRLINRQALEKVRNRIDRYGVAEPSIQRVGDDRISVELPGLKNPDRAINIIKQAGKLEFKIVDESVPTPDLTAMIAEAREEHNLPEDYSAKSVDALNRVLREKLPEDTEIAFETKYDPVSKKITGAVPYLLERQAHVTGEMLKNAQVQVRNNEPYVSLTFDAQGSQKFGEITSKNVGRKMAILLDGTVNKAPVIREAIMGGEAQITLGYGDYSDLLKEAEDLSLVLQEGALPAQLVEATKTIVGPSLGADSIHNGLVATFFGALCVIVFMLVYYRLSGILADLALVFNLLFILAGLALFQATLTLPGIAGIALTFGMAVDANVLIFERIREELRSGKTASAAVKAGYGNAMRAIIDSNLTTLIAGVVLYQFGTGPIRGFAVTLIMGLLISMYTAIVCTRMVYDYLLVKKRIKRISV